LKKGHFLWCPLFMMLLLGSVQCVNLDIPHREYSLARSAYRAAVDSEAARFSPNLYHKAERYFKRGEQLYEERKYQRSVTYFQKARAYSERAESVARLKQFKAGDME